MSTSLKRFGRLKSAAEVFHLLVVFARCQVSQKCHCRMWRETSVHSFPPTSALKEFVKAKLSEEAVQISTIRPCRWSALHCTCVFVYCQSCGSPCALRRRFVLVPKSCFPSFHSTSEHVVVEESCGEHAGHSLQCSVCRKLKLYSQNSLPVFLKTQRFVVETFGRKGLFRHFPRAGGGDSIQLLRKRQRVLKQRLAEEESAPSRLRHRELASGTPASVVPTARQISRCRSEKRFEVRVQQAGSDSDRTEGTFGHLCPIHRQGAWRHLVRSYQDGCHTGAAPCTLHM